MTTIGGIGGTISSAIGARPAGSATVVRAGGGSRDGTAALGTSARIVAEGAPIELDRVAALRAAIRAGSYRPDPAAIADRMIAGDLG